MAPKINWLMANNLTLVGVFDNQQQTENAVQSLRNAGYKPDVITESTSDQQLKYEVEAEKAGHSVVVSAMRGGMVGAIFGFLTSAITFMLGLWTAIGWDFVGAGLGGVILGYAVGVIAASFYRLNSGENKADMTKETKNQGQYARILLNVSNEKSLEEGKAILARNGAYGTRYYKVPGQLKHFKSEFNG